MNNCKLAIIGYGANDIGKISESEFTDNLAQIAERYIGEGCGIIFLSIPRRQVLLQLMKLYHIIMLLKN